ncbi:hypothetical protein RA307_31715 [Xanthobacteraceae bacterium Astr-EGSB]|uniref:hypothetical protein n=1 Tax=Astrobacterium formosum TaxID=3069710 RepID=UPI0027B3D172|nr:hypothetical protein [Xanthobacteraceae bacterium Astr-EGSB]
MTKAQASAQTTHSPDNTQASCAPRFATEGETDIARIAKAQAPAAKAAQNRKESEERLNQDLFMAYLMGLSAEEQEAQMGILKLFCTNPVRVLPKDGRLVPDPETPEGYRRLMERFGGTDIDFVYGLLAQIANASTGPKEIDSREASFIVSFVNAVAPADPIEVLLVTQMALIHNASIRAANQFKRATIWKGYDSAARSLTQLGRTFAAQTEALKRYRTGGEQKVTVQHVSVGEGGQAIVSQVNQTGQRASDATAVSRSDKKKKSLTSPREAPMEMLGEQDQAAPKTCQARSS